MAKPKPADFKAQAQVFKALAHPGRLLMLDELSRGERCVCELAALVSSEMPTVSRHLAQLKHAGIVDDVRWSPIVEPLGAYFKLAFFEAARVVVCCPSLRP